MVYISDEMNILYFYHIPKCGGTYIEHVLKRTASRCGGQYVPFVNLSDDKKQKQLDQQMLDYLEQLSHNLDDHPILIHHHHGYPGLGEISGVLKQTKQQILDQGGQMQITTVVREPMSHITSRINYVDYLTVHDVITNPVYQNYQSRYLLYNHWKRWHGKVPDVSWASIEEVLSIIDHTYVLDDLHNLARFISQYLGSNKVVSSVKRNQGKIKVRPTDKELADLKECNQFDEMLYAHACMHRPVSNLGKKDPKSIWRWL